MEVGMTKHVNESMEVIGSDGGFVGTVDRVEGQRIKLSRSDGFGKHKKHHHYLDLSLVSRVDGQRAYLSISAETAVALVEEERSGDQH
jgi:hypothetical protein